MGGGCGSDIVQIKPHYFCSFIKKQSTDYFAIFVALSLNKYSHTSYNSL